MGHFQAIREISNPFTRNWPPTWEIAKREVSDRYKGPVFGTLWAAGHPLFLMGVYVFVFAVVFKVKAGEAKGLQEAYVRRVLEEHLTGKVNHRLLIWSLLSFEFWNRLFLDGEGLAADYEQGRV
jgi:hypothetical protein